MMLKKILFVSIAWLYATASTATEKTIPIVEINDFWNNNINFKLELNSDDIWQTPEETWILKQGDCEDYAIAKYFDLIANGAKKDDLYLSWVIIYDSDKAYGKQYLSHMILIYEKDGKKWVLDNYRKEIVEIEQRKDIVKVIAILNEKESIYNYMRAKRINPKWENILKKSEENLAFINELNKMK